MSLAEVTGGGGLRRGGSSVSAQQWYDYVFEEGGSLGDLGYVLDLFAGRNVEQIGRDECNIGGFTGISMSVNMTLISTDLQTFLAIPFGIFSRDSIKKQNNCTFALERATMVGGERVLNKKN